MTNILMSQVVLEEEVVESWFIDDPDMEIQVKTLNSKSDTSANYATTSANIKKKFQVSHVYFMKYSMMGLLHMPNIMSSIEADPYSTYHDILSH